MRTPLIKILNIHLCYCFRGLFCTGDICWLRLAVFGGPVNPRLTCKSRGSLFIHFYPNIAGVGLYSKLQLKQMARFSPRPRS